MIKTLFEISYKKVYEDGSEKTKRYQIPATDIHNACARLGQVFNGQMEGNEYELVILGWKECG